MNSDTSVMNSKAMIAVSQIVLIISTVILSTLGGYALGQMQIPKSEAIIVGFMAFSFIPGIAIYIPLFKMLATVHMAQNYLSLILPYTAWQIPFSMYILKKFFETVPMDLVESARLDGCGEFKKITTWFSP